MRARKWTAVVVNCSSMYVYEYIQYEPPEYRRLSKGRILAMVQPALVLFRVGNLTIPCSHGSRFPTTGLIVSVRCIRTYPFGRMQGPRPLSRRRRAPVRYADARMGMNAHAPQTLRLVVKHIGLLRRCLPVQETAAATTTFLRSFLLLRSFHASCLLTLAV